MKAYVFLLFILCLHTMQLGAQVVQTIDTLIGSGSTFTFQNNSQTDYTNDRKLKSNYFPYADPDFINFYSAYLPPRESIDTLTFFNEGMTDLSDFYFFLNDNRTMNLDSLVPTIFAGCSTERDKAQAIYQYVKDHHLYYFAVDKADPIYENYNGSKMLNVYGIGNCGMIANAAAQLSALHTGTDQRHWFVSNGDHGISELRFDSTYICVDADQEGLYLLPDNKTLASFYDVYRDSHHYLRSKHFSNAVGFNYNWNLHFNETYRVGGHYINHTDTLQNFNEPCCPKLNGLRGENITFKLKPQSSVSFIPNDTLEVTHFVHTQPPPSAGTVLLNLGKGLLQTNFGPLGLQIYPSLSALNGISIHPSDSSYTPAILQQAGTMVIKESAPYVFSDANLHFDYRLGGAGDSIRIYFSKDSLQWTEINWNKQYGLPFQSYQINLLNYILPNSTKATYTYFIKIIVYQTTAASAASIRKVRVISQFQYNKLTGPKLQRGSNQLRLFSSVNGNLRIKLRWTENHLNHPPSNNIQPIFPPDSLVSDSSAFSFRWTVPSDPDGDSIVDYHIQVSDRSDMRFPLSTLYDRCLWLTNGGKPIFTPEVNDYFNHQSAYYWRVRSQDSKGVWSEWSNTFSFKVKTPMYPRNLRWEIVADSIRDVIRLAWDKNQDGDSAAYYKVMGSGNILGFEASDSKFYGNTLREDILVHFPTGRKRYRVRAIGAYNNQSASSYFINLPVSKTLLLGSTFNYLDTFANNLNAQVQPFPPVNTENRPIFYVVDPAKILINGNLLTAIDTGRTMVDICTRINQDTIRLMTAFVRILAAFPAPANKPTLLVWAKDTSSIYGDQVISNGFRYSGFVGAHDSNILAIKPTMSTQADSSSETGLYSLVPGNAFSPLYHILYQPGILRILPRDLTLRAQDTVLTYGTVCNSFGFSAIGLVNNDNLGIMLQAPSLNSVYTPFSLPGTYPLSISGGATKNYDIKQYIPGQITVEKAILSASPNPIVSTYGDQPQSAGISYNGFQNGENDSVLNVVPNVMIDADIHTDAGWYPINLQGGQSDRYQFQFTPSTLQINKAAIQITCLDTSSVYGTPPVVSEWTYTGLKGDDTKDSILLAPTLQVSADSSSSCGQYIISASGAADSNYHFTYAPGVLTIKKAPLLVVPHDTLLEYGDFPPGGITVGLTVTGFVNNDSLSDIQQLPSIYTNAGVQSPAGIYRIYTVAGTDSNYTFVHDSSVLTITKAPLAVIAGNSQSVYGTIPIVNNIQFQGFKLNDTINALNGTPQIKTDADQYSAPGNYPVYFIPNQVSASNYQILFIPGNHTVTKKDLLLRAKDQSMSFRSTLPILSYEATGFVNNDSIEDLDQAVVISTNCTDTSYAGEYLIEVSPITDSHYSVATENGILRVEPTMPAVELPRAQMKENLLHCDIHLAESGGFVDDIGLQISRKADQFAAFSTIPLKDRSLLSAPFNISYADSVELQIPNEEFLIRAYASNKAGTVYSEIKTIQHFRDDYLFVLHSPGGSEILILSGKSYQQGSIDLFSPDGKKILSRPIDHARISFPLSHLNTGIYYLRIYSPTLNRYSTERLLIR